MWVLHHCDNPPCVNPDHLYCGWPADNTADMMARGRYREQPVGGFGAKLTEQKVLQIRQMAAEGQSNSEIAKHFGLYRGTVREIVQGSSWQDVGGPRTYVGRVEKSSRFTGVWFDPRYGTWGSRVSVGGESLHLGNFTDELDAARAYNNAVIQRNLNRSLNEIDECEVSAT
jgi:hypothetical protein